MSDSPDDTSRRLADARAGSRDALGQLFEACRGYLLMIAHQELDDGLRAKGGASDLVQETFLEAQRDFAGFHGSSEGELLAWLRRLLLNNLANFTRRYRDTAKRAVEREVALDGGSSSFNPGIAADTPTPSGQIIEAEQTKAVLQALERLPPDYRQVLLLRHQEERSFEEIAEVMGRSANAVHKLWARAVERMQQELEGAAE